MGRVKDHVQDFLENGGWDLGYDYGSLPDLSDFKNVIYNQIHYYDYIGEGENVAYKDR